MGDVRVKLKISGVREVLKSAGVTSELVRRGRRVQNAAGEGVQVVVKPHRYTSRVFVQTSDNASAKAEAESKVLTRALDAAR